MKKLLLCSAAAGGLLLSSAPAQAQLDMTIGGHTKNYVAWLDQDTIGGPGTADERTFDILRESELHFNVEGVADNGLTYGFMVEADVDTSDDFNVDESYMYLSNAWGRVNVGGEDGATYLLQVAAPSADSNIDGVRQYVQPVNYGLTDFTIINPSSPLPGVATINLVTGIATGDIFDANGTGAADAGDVRFGTAPAGDAFVFDFSGLFHVDYDNELSSDDEKLTYLTPVWNGFQLGASYTPESDRTDGDGTDGGTRDAFGVNDDDDEADYGSVYDIAARYEGQFNNVGFAFGAGYSHAELEEENTSLNAAGTIAYIDVDGDGAFTGGTDTALASLDDREEWNVGLDLDIGAFGVGAIYTEDDLGLSSGGDRDTFVVGVDYTSGPFQLGASYLNQDQEMDGIFGPTVDEMETERYTGGVIYTAAPGLTLRGSISFIEHEVDNSLGIDDVEATSVLGGIQFNF